MLYSAQEYLKREKTEKLETFVENYYAGSFTEDFSRTIPLVEAELRRRKKELRTESKKT